MIFMEVVYSYLMLVGMTLEQSRQKHPFNLRNSAMLFLLLIDNASVAMDLVYEAKNLKEYSDSVYLTTTVLVAMLNYAIVTWKMAELFRFFENLEDIVTASKWHTH